VVQNYRRVVLAVASTSGSHAVNAVGTRFVRAVYRRLGGTRICWDIACSLILRTSFVPTHGEVTMLVHRSEHQLCCCQIWVQEQGFLAGISRYSSRTVTKRKARVKMLILYLQRKCKSGVAGTPCASQQADRLNKSRIVRPHSAGMEWLM
jgi:hypothetical protein